MALGNTRGTRPTGGGPALPGLGLALVLVALGTALGALARGIVGAFLGQPFSVAGYTTILAVNLVGAFVLGIITELVGGRRGLAPHAKLALGTGFCGGFTTYSTFAMDVALVQVDGPPLNVLLYLVATMLVGVPAALSGIAVGAFLGERSARHRRVPAGAPGASAPEAAGSPGATE